MSAFHNKNAKSRAEPSDAAQVASSLSPSSLFSEELGNNQNEHIKELFNFDGSLEAKTDLTKEEISYVARLQYLVELTKNNALRVVLEQFMKLQVSKDRRGRKEYVEATVGSSQQGRQDSFFNRIGGMFGRG